MAKELPYFRFTPQEWQNGDISLLSDKHKGLFMDICCYYWIKNCSITKVLLELRFNNKKTLLKDLLKYEIIRVENDNEFIHIDFLDEQFDVLSKLRKDRQIAGSKGGKQRLSKTKAKLKQNTSYKDKDKDKYKDKYKNKEQNFIDKIVDLFKKVYEDNFELPYVITNKGKEKGCAGKILKIYKDKYPESDSDETLKGLEVYFNACCRINDNWLSQNMSLSIIINKFNEINKILKNGKNTGKSGATIGELAEMLTDKFGISREE